MKKCNNCKKRLSPSEEEIQICPYCGFGQGEGLFDLSLVEPLEEKDQYNTHSKVQLIGKLAFGLLLCLIITIIGYALMNPASNTMSQNVSNSTE